MVLTPADVHNVAFSKPRIGKRGYDEQEVDLFVDLVEQELIRHLEEEGELRSRCAELRDRFAGLRQREAELTRREAELAEREAELAQRGAQLTKRGSALPQQLAQLRHREERVAQREAQLAQREAELRRRLEHRPTVVARAGATASNGQPALTRAAAVNGASQPEEARVVASVHGRHDMERMAIRAVTDLLGNTVTETVHERTRRGPAEGRASAVALDRSTQLDRLRQENAELARSLGLLKSAAALLAAALDGP